MLNLVCQWLRHESNGPWLIILDNMDDARFAHTNRDDIQEQQHKFTVRKYLPQREGATVLITSQDSSAAFRLVGQTKHLLQVQAMTAEEAKAILDNKLDNLLGDDEKRKELATTLDYIPLALTQAAAYINRRQRMTIARYLDFLDSDKEGGISLLLTEESDLRRGEDVPNSVLRTWQITFDQIQTYHRFAADLLSRMSLFDRTGIPEFLLRATLVEGDFEEAIDILLGYAIINLEAAETSFGMHRLVQLSTNIWLQHDEQSEQQKELALAALAQTYPGGSFENWPACLLLEPHAQSVLHNDYYSKTTKRSRARIQRNRAWYYWQQGNLSMAELLAKQSLRDANETLGAEHRDTLNSMHILALVFDDQGRWNEAEKLGVQVAEARKKLLGAEHPDTLISLSNLVETYRKQGRWNEAEELGQQVMDTRKRVLGAEHPSTLVSMANLVMTFRLQKRSDEAKELGTQVIELRKRVLGSEHLHTLNSINNLGLVLGDQDKYEQAEEMYRRAFKGLEKVVGPEHPDTLTALGNLGMVLGDQSKYEEAEKILQQALEGQEKSLRPEHPSTLNTVNNLGVVLSKHSKYEEAEKLIRHALAGREKVLGPGHPDTLRTVRNRRWVLESQGKYEEAEAISQRKS